MEELNIHDNYEWHGIFSLPNNEKNIHGKIIYTPEDGIILEYLCDFATDFKKEDHIYGKLHNGKICTLIGKLDLNTSGLSIGKTAVRHGQLKFDFLIYGEFLTPKEKFIGFDTTFTSLQEFCYPQGLKDHLDYSNESLCKFKNESIEISIQHSAKTNFAPEKISTLFISESNKTLENLDTETQEIYKKYRDHLYTKKDISFFIRTKEFPNKEIFDLYKTLFKLELFFTTLIHHPVRANTFKLLQIYERDLTKHKAISALFSPFDLDKKKIKNLNKKISHHNLPINLSKFKFDYAIEKWIDNIDDFFIVSERIQNNNNSYYDYQLHADIVIFLTQIESISKSEGKNKSNEKYDYAISKYLKNECLNYLKHIINDENIGKSLSDLRSEIAHVKSKKQILKKLNGSDLIIISNILLLTICGYILEKLGMAKELINDYQIRNMYKINYDI